MIGISNAYLDVYYIFQNKKYVCHNDHLPISCKCNLIVMLGINKKII